MKIIILLLLAAFGIGLAVPAAATAQTTSHHSVSVSANACKQSFYYHWSVSPDPWQWETKWYPHNYDDCWQQSALKCESRIGTFYWFHGGIVYPADKYSGVKCNGSYPTPYQGNINECPVSSCLWYDYYIVWYFPAASRAEHPRSKSGLGLAS